MLITSSATHEFDLTRWLLGQEVVAATVLTPRPSGLVPDGVRDPQLIVLETEAGVLVDVEVFVNARYGYDIRCELVGESGTLTLSPPASVEIRGEGADGREVDDDFRARFVDAYRVQLQAWVDGLAGERTDGPSAWDGYAAAAVADACIASLRSGQRTLVRRAPRPDLYAGRRSVAVTR
jgi:myo-inositol 2-dehydrogenase/D-chiro-inositol 1-dehydrogenase